MKNQLSKGRLQAILSLCAVISAIGVFVKYSETVSSEKIENDIKTDVQTASPRSYISQRIGSPIIFKAVAFGESMPVRDMPRSGFDPTEMNIIPKEIGEIRRAKQTGEDRVSTEVPDVDDKEINAMKNVVRTVDPNVPRLADGALLTDNKISNLSLQVLPTPTVSFEGISVFDTVSLGQGFLPPDTTGEAGTNHYVQAVNAAFRVWDKSGTPMIPTTSLGTLFSGISGPCRSTIDGSPVVLYDQLADRWLISQRCERVLPSHMLIAISKTGDPTGAYYLYDFMMPNVKHVDSPKLGVWTDGYYMTDHQFDKRGIFFRGAGFFAFERAKMLAGDPTASYVYFDSCPENLNCVVAGALPSDLDGFIPPPAGVPNVFSLFTADEYNDPQGDGLRLFDFHVDFATPANSTFIERIGSPLQAAALDPLASFVAQPDVLTSRYLHTISDRLMFRLAYRNFGTGTETLVVTHTVDTLTQDHVGVRYYQLNRTAPGGPFTIAEQQTFSPDDTSRWMASGAMNFQGDTVIGFSASSTTVYPSIRYAAKLSTDPAGSGLAQGEQTIIAGSGSQFSSTRRWGDYSDMTVDPTDDCMFWYTQEYYAASNTNGWQTRIAKFAPRSCSVSPRGTIQGTITSCVTGLPLTGVSVDASGGFNRLTGMPGIYSMTVIPGTYTVSPEKVGYSASPIGGVVVTDGGTAIRDFCMAPVATLSTPVPTITTGNNLVEPNECNSLNIPITNNGAATATSVSATLSTTTQGVTITSATSVYPDIAANGGIQTNTTPFQISTDNTVACLTSINLTLRVTYAGGGSPSVLSIPMTVGQPKVPNYVFTASTGATISTTGTLVPGSPDNLAVTVTMPFAFTLYGKSVAAGQTMSVHQFGVIEFVTNDPNPYPLNHGLPALEFESPIAVIMPYWDDLAMRSVTGSGIFIETTGIAPNRTFMIEWRAQNFPGQSGGPVDTDFAVLFHENSDDFDYLYSQTGSGSAAFGASATFGIQGLSYGNNFTQYSPFVFPGLKLTASRPGPICSQGSGTCGGLTATRTRFDFDGDGKSDISVFRPSYGVWYLLNSQSGFTGFQFGIASDRPVPADFDGDGRTDLAVYRDGTWFIQRSTLGFTSIQFGITEDVPQPADFDGDGRSELAVFRPSNGIWYVFNLVNSQFTGFQFGSLEDKPVVGDYDGDTRADYAVFRPSNGVWYYQQSTAGFGAIQFGLNTDKPVPADYDGDGKTDVAVYRPSNGIWYYQRSTAGFGAIQFGLDTDKPSPADYDGDGRADVAVFRPSNGIWYLQQSTAGFTGTQFGIAEDKPIPNTFVPQ